MEVLRDEGKSMGSSSQFTLYRNILFLVSLFLVLLTLAISRSPLGGFGDRSADTRHSQIDRTLKAQSALDAGDYALAIPLLRVEAEAGVAAAAFALAELYERGRGTGRDYEQAYHWYQLAAQRGHAESQYALARIYAYGYGVERDTAQAAIWSQRAIDSGYGQQASTPATESQQD